MRKILGILNIVAGASILGLLIWLWSHSNLAVTSTDTKSIFGLALFLLVTGTSLASGILVLKRRWKILAILAAVNLIFAGFVLFVLVLGVLFALFPT